MILIPTMIEIVKDAKHSPKLSKRSKAKAKKVQLLFQQEQELQKQEAVAIIKAADIIADERLHMMDIEMDIEMEMEMEMEINSSSSSKNSSSSSKISSEYNDIIYNDSDNKGNENNDHNGCFLSNLVPFFENLREDKHDNNQLFL